MPRPGESHVVGIDVGTGSARAGIVTVDGRCLAHASVDTETATPRAEFFEQSSDGIWDACGRAVRAAIERSGVDPASIVGIGIDATSCSLVALDADDRPVTVSPEGDDRWNVVLWMDHRATEEAEVVNRTGHEALRHVGGRISPEMAPPKLLWIKRHLPGTWKRARRFIDLADFLTYRATGNDVRSMCTTVCKWTYLGHREGDGWPRDLFDAIGLADLFDGDRQGTDIRPVGEVAGRLSPTAAGDLGLPEGIRVAVGIIDAHAGGLGLLGAALGDGSGADDSGADDGGAEDSAARATLERSLALIGGTSSCHMAVSRDAKFLRGIWGPYFSAMVPGMWLTEGGQSSTGSLIDHVINDSAAAPEARRLAEERGTTVYDVLNAEVDRLASERGVPVAELTAGLHVLPYFLGNRSPRADASLRGVVSGLGLDASLASLAVRYLAAVQAIAYGTRHIIAELNAGGYEIDAVHVCGGGTKNPVWLAQHADITGCRLDMPAEPEAVLLGAAILGAVASGVHGDVLAAMRAMGRSSRTVEPDPGSTAYHDRKYRVFHRMYDHFLELRELMGASVS